MSKINVSFGSGCSDLFLQVQENGTLRVLDYEYDCEEIHRICGGRKYYSSRSGMSGEGWIEAYRNLIPVGYYRTDVAHFDWMHAIEVAENISVMLPYRAHTPKKDYCSDPVVIVNERFCEADVIVYTSLDRVAEVVKALHLCKEDSLGEVREYTKKFVDENGYTTELKLHFVNMWGQKSYNPWHFLVHKLRKFVCDEWSGVWGAFGLTKLEEDFYCKKHLLAGKYYRGERIEGLTDEIFEEGGEALAAFVPDWEFFDTGARKSTRNGQGYRALCWINPEKYREFYIPKIFMDTTETLDELKTLMGMQQEENIEETNGDEE